LNRGSQSAGKVGIRVTKAIGSISKIFQTAILKSKKEKEKERI